MNLKSLKIPNPDSFARFLGFFSLALGVAELVAPRAVSRAAGMGGDKPGLLRGYGAREVATGIGILASKNPEPWLWARVAGDALDMATVGAGRRRSQGRTAAIALVALAGVAAMDVVAARNARLKQQAKKTARDYSDRSGFPRPADQMRGAAKEDFQPPRDMRTPEPMRPASIH
ncbi:hypothetical protein [Ideonella sp. BN130291]|uniref:hypothetical protein n=1 Tax=Ideonella sp. BN130291 TaxID=3112940 RepID=UPI002E25EA10|nr:hypothetical protein [Ideonella sp. BN130291]